MHCWSPKVDRILSVGVWLGPHHRNWALTREQALNAINQLRDADVLVLGGDVLTGSHESYSHTYDNWYFEPSVVIDSNVVAASALKASTYVMKYPRDDVYFVLVPGYE